MKLVSTYSIIAVCKKTSEMGAAVQSHWFSVGSVVPWAEPGVGVIATQSIAEVSYGPLGLALMKQGKTPEQALKALLTVDPQRELRQVAMINVEGEVQFTRAQNAYRLQAITLAKVSVFKLTW